MKHCYILQYYLVCIIYLHNTSLFYNGCTRLLFRISFFFSIFPSELQNLLRPYLFCENISKNMEKYLPCFEIVNLGRDWSYFKFWVVQFPNFWLFQRFLQICKISRRLCNQHHLYISRNFSIAFIYQKKKELSIAFNDIS